MAIGDVLLLRDEQVWNSSIQVINQYFYEVTTAATLSNESTALGEAFIANVLPGIESIQGEVMLHNRISVRNLGVPTDFNDILLSPPAQGNLAEDAMPPFVTWTFQYVRGTLAVRHGWKRIAGVTEPKVEAGVAISSFLATLAGVAEDMEEQLGEDGGTGIYVPRIARLTYLDGELTDWEVFPINQVVYAHVGSQNSRKFGRGA